MKVQDAIEQTLNLEPIIIKAMDSVEGYGWDFGFACRGATEYRRFLMLCPQHLYQTDFGEEPPADLWTHDNRCPNCGRRVNNDIAMTKRPALAV